MSSGLEVDPARLHEAARFISDRAGYLEERIATLDRVVGHELLATGWQGRSASAYDESWLEWKAGADAVVEALTQSASALDTTATLYEAQEDHNTESITQAGGEQLA